MADIGLAQPAILALYRHCAEAPATICEEGYWDDQESACNDGYQQAWSQGAALMRDALKALGYEPPAGRPVCEDCYRFLDDGHSSQCPCEDEEHPLHDHHATLATDNNQRTEGDDQ